MPVPDCCQEQNIKTDRQPELADQTFAESRRNYAALTKEKLSRNEVTIIAL